jgi:hypothetical protein
MPRDKQTRLPVGVKAQLDYFKQRQGMGNAGR